MLRSLLLLLALSLAFCAAPVDAGPKMPPFSPEIQSMVGTWSHAFKVEGKKRELFLVIKEENGQLRLRYQLPVRKKKFSSDWDGQIELKLQVNMRQKHKTTYRIGPDATIQVVDERRFSGTGSNRNRVVVIEGAYRLSPDGKELGFHCVKRTDSKKKNKELACFSPLVYKLKSPNTKWPD